MSSQKKPQNQYMPIENYGVVGNLETVALIGMNGSVDFMCFPHFDSPTVFCRLLDAQKGGYFQIRPAQDDLTCKQMYLPDTNILLTRFHSPHGILELIDFMPLGHHTSQQQLIRVVKAVRGNIEVRVDCQCSFDYCRKETRVEPDENNHSVMFYSDGEQTPSRLHSEIPLRITDRGGAHTEFVLKEDEQRVFSFMCDANCDGQACPLEEAQEALEYTSEYWRNWISNCNYDGLWRDHVRRSALTLKLLFSNQYGSMVAAPTFGLPEAIGGSRNWDYRYCWIRDSAFTVHALLRLGFTDETTRYVKWVTERYEQCNSSGLLQLMYRLDGSSDLEEEELPELEGYKQSKPVRIGNAAKDQLQLDIYGELIDSIFLANKFSTPITVQGWKNISHTIEYVCDNWQKPDEGIWEFRGGRKHFLHSRLMCWVAVDRAIRISVDDSLPAPLAHWREVRDAIYNDILENFWNEKRQAFVQFKGADTMDASVLLMPMVKFISPFDPMWTSTMAALKEDLVVDAFVKRYKSSPELESIDGSDEGNFTMCSFWYCEILARSGQVAEATLLFEKMLGYANHLGLYSEECGFEGQHLGNFPQAFTHLALVSAASAIDRAKAGETMPF